MRLDVLRHHQVGGSVEDQRCHADGIVTFEFERDRIVRAWAVLQWR